MFVSVQLAFGPQEGNFWYIVPADVAAKGHAAIAQWLGERGVAGIQGVGTIQPDAPSGVSSDQIQDPGNVFGGQFGGPVDRGRERGDTLETFREPSGIEQQSLRSAFQQFLGGIDPSFTPTGPATRARTFAEQQFDPFASAFNVLGRIRNIDPESQEFGGEFSQFLRPQGIDPFNALRDVLTRARIETRAGGFAPAGSERQRALAPQTGQEGATLANLALQAQRRGLAPALASTGGIGARDLFARYAAGRAGREAAGQPQVSYIDALSDMLGLRRLGFT